MSDELKKEIGDLQLRLWFSEWKLEAMLVAVSRFAQDDDDRQAIEKAYATLLILRVKKEAAMMAKKLPEQTHVIERMFFEKAGASFPWAGK
jgi:hypothetical protein